MTPKQLADYVRYRTKTDVGSLSDPELTLLYTPAKDDIATEIVARVDPDFFGMQFDADLELDDDGLPVREIPLPSDILSIDKVQVKLDGENFVVLTETDITQIDGVIREDEDSVSSYFQNVEGSAFYDMFRGSLWLFTGAFEQVINGITIYGSSWPNTIASDGWSEAFKDISIPPDTTSHGIPRQLHELLADRMVITWKTSGDKEVPLTQREENWEFLLRKKLRSIRHMNKGQSTILRTRTPGTLEHSQGYNY